MQAAGEGAAARIRSGSQGIPEGVHHCTGRSGAARTGYCVLVTINPAIEVSENTISGAIGQNHRTLCGALVFESLFPQGIEERFVFLDRSTRTQRVFVLIEPVRANGAPTPV